MARTNALLVETGITGREQESEYMNGTLQGSHDLAWTIHTYIDAPTGDEAATTLYLSTLLRQMEQAVNHPEGKSRVRFELRIGPEYDPE